MKFLALLSLMLAISVSANADDSIVCGTAAASSNPTIKGITGPSVSTANGELVMSMTLDTLADSTVNTIHIPHFPNSTLAVGPDLNCSGTSIVLKIKLKDFFEADLWHLKREGLPGGRPIPIISDGALPAINLHVSRLFHVVLYLHRSRDGDPAKNMIGLFVPQHGLNDPSAILSFDFFNSSNVSAGTLSLIGDDHSGRNGGLLLLTNPTASDF